PRARRRRNSLFDGARPEPFRLACRPPRRSRSVRRLARRKLLRTFERRHDALDLLERRERGRYDDGAFGYFEIAKLRGEDPIVVADERVVPFAAIEPRFRFVAIDLEVDDRRARLERPKEDVAVGL